MIVHRQCLAVAMERAWTRWTRTLVDVMPAGPTLIVGRPGWIGVHLARVRMAHVLSRMNRLCVIAR